MWLFLTESSPLTKRFQGQGLLHNLKPQRISQTENKGCRRTDKHRSPPYFLRESAFFLLHPFCRLLWEAPEFLSYPCLCQGCLCRRRSRAHPFRLTREFFRWSEWAHSLHRRKPSHRFYRCREEEPAFPSRDNSYRQVCYNKESYLHLWIKLYYNYISKEKYVKKKKKLRKKFGK